MTYLTSNARFAVSTATCNALTLAVNESNTVGFLQESPSKGAGQNSAYSVFRKVHSVLEFSTSPQPHRPRPPAMSSSEASAETVQWWAWFRSIAELPPSCSSDLATMSKERQNTFTPRRNSAGEHRNPAAVSDASCWPCNNRDSCHNVVVRVKQCSNQPV